MERDIRDQDKDISAADLQNMSKYERQQFKLRQQISKLEEELVADKPWLLKVLLFIFQYHIT